MSADAETERQQAVRRYAVLDTPREREFDQLARLASQICQTPFAAICVIDSDRQWFKAAVGLSVVEVPRAMSLCAETIQQQGVLVVNDALNDPRFRETFFV